MIAGGLATGDQAIFDLDFHAVMHWGTDPALEKHYVPTRSQRARSVLTFFAQDSGTHNLVYANADLSKATQNREVIAFCDHWKAVSGHDPHLLVMDQKVTTQPVLAELDARGDPLPHPADALTRAACATSTPCAPADYKTITLDRSGPHNRPRVHESTVAPVQLPRHRAPAHHHRTGPRRPHRDHHQRPASPPPSQLITRYARRMTIEQRLAEIIRAFHADALSSTVNLNVDLDIMLCVLAQALLAALRARLPGYAAVTPDVLQRRFLETPGQIITTPDAITVRLDRRAYTPVLRQADLHPTPPSPGGATAPSATNSPDPLRRTSCVEIRANESDRSPAAVDRHFVTGQALLGLGGAVRVVGRGPLPRRGSLSRIPQLMLMLDTESGVAATVGSP